MTRISNKERDRRIVGDYIAGGYELSELAREYNVSESRIRQILAAGAPKTEKKKKKTPTSGMDVVQVQDTYDGVWTEIKIYGMPKLEVRGEPEAIYNQLFEQFSTPADKLKDYLEENPVSDQDAERILKYLTEGTKLAKSALQLGTEMDRMQGVSFTERP